MTQVYDNSRSPRLLMTNRQGVVLLERAKVFLQGGRVVYQVAESGQRKTFNIPFANVAVLALGQGTSLTQEAARALAEEGVFVSFTGTGGTPLHFGSLTQYEPTGYMWRMFEVARDRDLSLEAARIIMRARVAAFTEFSDKIARAHMKTYPSADVKRICRLFERKIEAAKSTQSLMGEEGNFAKGLYAAFAKTSGIKDFRRIEGAGQRGDPAASANSKIDQGNYLAYGIAGASLWSLGIPRGLSVLHGKTRKGGLVFDLADSFKDALVLPLAFSGLEGTEFREAAIAAIQDHRLLARSFSVVRQILDLAPSFAGAAAMDQEADTPDHQELAAAGSASGAVA